MSNKNLDEDQLINAFLDNKIQTFEFFEELLEYGFIDSNDEYVSKYKNFDTPWNIASYMIELSKIDLNTTILEPAFNHGVFLLALLEHMKFNYKMSPLELLSWFNNKVTGYEENKLKFESVRNIIVLYFFKYGLDINNSQLYNLFNDNFINNKKQTSFHDIAIGAIPYNQLKELHPSEANTLNKIYPTTRGFNQEVSGAYFEQTWNFSERFCFLSSNLFLEDDSNHLSKFLLPKITHLINFQRFISSKIFRGVSIVHGFTHLKNNTCFYSNDIYHSFKSENKEFLSSNFDLNNSRLNSTIFQPLNYHELFHIKVNNDKFLTNSEFDIEKELCIPFIDFSINNYQDKPVITNYVLYPYSNFSLIDEYKLSKLYPKTYKYLLSEENSLLERDLGKGYEYENFYAYSNQFGVAHFLPSKILVIPFYINDSVKPYIIQSSDIHDSEYFFFKGAFLLDGEDDYINNQFQSEKFLNFLQKHSSPISLNIIDTFKVQFNLIQQFLGQI